MGIGEELYKMSVAWYTVALLFIQVSFIHIARDMHLAIPVIFLNVERTANFIISLFGYFNFREFKKLQKAVAFYLNLPKNIWLSNDSQWVKHLPQFSKISQCNYPNLDFFNIASINAR